MNLVGHIEVAARCGLDGDGQFGAILPDLAAMLRVRIDHDALAPAVATGVRLHHSTDAAFHNHREVRATMATIGVSLTARGVGRGASRSAAHVGYEMLLDAAVVDRLGDVVRNADDNVAAAALHDSDRWLDLRDHFATRTPRHDDPRWVAERLHAVLRHRPRLSFPHEQVPDVAAALADHAAHISFTAPSVFDDVTAAVSIGV